MNSKISEARVALDDAVLRMQSAAEAIETAGEGVDVPALESEFDAATADVEARQASLQRYEKVAEARATAPALASDARVVSEEPTYRPDAPDRRSFFTDLVRYKTDPAANERIMRHAAESRAYTDTAISTGGGGFVIPQYMMDLYVGVARAGRKFADAVPSLPLTDSGMTAVFPKLTGGTTEAAQVEGSATSFTNATSDYVTEYVRTIAGRQDITQQLLDRGAQFDQIIFRDLALAHATELNRQMIRGAAASSEVVGIRNVSSINTVTYTDASPTGAELFPKLAAAVSQINSNRYLAPTHWVMHPRRAAWLMSETTSSPLLFQQTGFNYPVAGGGDNGLVGTILGLPVIADATVGTTYGSGTNEDEIYLVRADDLYLMEGPIMTRVLEQPLSADLAVRLDLYSYVLFASQRYPKSICKISGTGLAAPSGF